jgi:hypothetical protein
MMRRSQTLRAVGRRPVAPRATFAVLLGFTVASTAACSGTKSPGVDVTGVQLGDVTDEGFVLHFDLRMENPNIEPLELDEVHYRVSIDGREVYRGRRSAEATLSAGGDKILRLPAVVTPVQGGDATPPVGEVEYAISGTLWYLTPGELAEILFDSGVRRPSVGFRQAGALMLRTGD